jgi:hypothetical protein
MIFHSNLRYEICFIVVFLVLQNAYAAPELRYGVSFCVRSHRKSFRCRRGPTRHTDQPASTRKTIPTDTPLARLLQQNGPTCHSHSRRVAAARGTRPGRVRARTGLVSPPVGPTGKIRRARGPRSIPSLSLSSPECRREMPAGHTQTQWPVGLAVCVGAVHGMRSTY